MTTQNPDTNLTPPAPLGAQLIRPPYEGSGGPSPQQAQASWQAAAATFTPQAGLDGAQK